MRVVAVGNLVECEPMCMDVQDGRKGRFFRAVSMSPRDFSTSSDSKQRSDVHARRPRQRESLASIIVYGDVLHPPMPHMHACIRACMHTYMRICTHAHMPTCMSGC